MLPRAASPLRVLVDVCKILRQAPRFKDTLIIAQTGWGHKRDRELVAQLAQIHPSKPA